jgi:hypothetical protein
VEDSPRNSEFRLENKYLLDVISPLVQPGMGLFGVHPADVVVITVVVVDVASTENVVVTSSGLSVVLVSVKTVTVVVIDSLDVATTDSVDVMDAVAIMVVVEVFVIQGFGVSMQEQAVLM